jgi:hypothetical protein
MKDILDEELNEQILTEVENMDPETLEAEARKILAAVEKRKSYHKEKTPEALEKQKEYRAKKYAREKAILRLAKEKGIV